MNPTADQDVTQRVLLIWRWTKRALWVLLALVLGLVAFVAYCWHFYPAASALYQGFWNGIATLCRSA
jgi:hypothetical protein